MQVTQAETTRDTHHEDLEDGKLYNIILNRKTGKECKSFPPDNFANFMGKDFELPYSWSSSKIIDHVINQGELLAGW